MRNIDKILEHITVNEEIAKKFFEIEAGILSVGSFRDLFETLLQLIEEKFSIPHVWITMVRENDVSHLMEALESSDVLRERLNVVKRKVFLKLINEKGSPVLVNEDLKPFYALLPKNQKYFAKSLAVVPITLDGEVIGSLNLGDFSESRFQPDMDTFFLSELAVKISICLSNVTSRERLTFLATRDPLTGLLNRREMETMLDREFSRAVRYGTPLAVLFIDCDEFKTVNDTYGHDCGDTLLKYLAEQIRAMIRKDDLAFRYAGDEFVVVLPNQTSKQALKVSERLQRYFEKNPLKFQESRIPISISCGMASTRDPDIKNPEALLKKADERLYEVKNKKESRYA
ncbi:MAG: sensor domain-containing diguanylate cyclase [Deltaproteobacteria bacterium]|nr:sensor domain-containing diguanylate cyclase [Deltaproteobacteria bacterium]MBW2076997.1 sensor domain-containing diguanylate cyclase [Deltaproteobacteria bacterium]